MTVDLPNLHIAITKYAQERQLTWEHNVFRSKCISLECRSRDFGERGFACVRFHRLPIIRKEEIILPDETMKIIERNIVHYFRQRLLCGIQVAQSSVACSFTANRALAKLTRQNGWLKL